LPILGVGSTIQPVGRPETRVPESKAPRFTPMSTAKQRARKLLEEIPDDATWDDIIHHFYVRKKIEVALDAVEAGCVVPHEEVKKTFLSEWELLVLDRFDPLMRTSIERNEV